VQRNNQNTGSFYNTAVIKNDATPVELTFGSYFGSSLSAAAEPGAGGGDADMIFWILHSYLFEAAIAKNK
jgi:hypothetical protein